MTNKDNDETNSNATFIEGRGGGQGKPRTPSGKRKTWQPPKNPTPQDWKDGQPMNPRNSRYFVKLVGDDDPQPEVQHLKNSPFLEDIFNNTPIFYNRPMTGRRGPCCKLDVDLLAGFVVPGTTRQMHEGPDGPGVYAIAEILHYEEARFQSLLGTPFGLDITEDPDAIKSPYQAVISVDVVVDPRGSGKVIGNADDSDE